MCGMPTRLRGRAVRRPSLPLTEEDERQLATIREGREYREVLASLSGEEVADQDASEAVLLHAVFEAGLLAVRNAAAAEGYAVIAAEQKHAAERRADARRRRPPWADEA